MNFLKRRRNGNFRIFDNRAHWWIRRALRALDLLLREAPPHGGASRRSRSSARSARLIQHTGERALPFLNFIFTNFTKKNCYAPSSCDVPEQFCSGLIAGDFNINLHSVYEHAGARLFQESFLSTGFYPTISLSTHVWWPRSVIFLKRFSSQILTLLGRGRAVSKF